jgi:hypothetical protein
MRLRIAVASLAALLATAPGARAQGDPIMPLAEVRQGMKCKAFSVVQGTEPVQFDAEVLDLVGGDSGARILVRVSGEAIDATGIGAGFSGSPIYCPGSDGKPKNAGAISETIGDFGGKTVLVTPIEAILGTSPDPPAEPGPAPTPAPTPAGARRLNAAISVRGLDTRVFGALRRAGLRTGRTFIQAPPLSLQAQPAMPGFKPGSAVGVGLSSGDLSIGAIGTVAYVDGDKVWSFGHQFDGVGRRSLFLQDAYVAGVIGNPVQTSDGGGTYKLAGAVSDRGTATNDGFSAVAGKLGGLPPSIPVRVYAKDEESGREMLTDVAVADETDIGTPTGTSALAFIAPLAVTQAATSLYQSIPIRLAGEMCLRIALRERPKPIRVCNRYVSDGTGGGVPQGGNLVGLRAGSDASEILALIDTYRPTGLHVTEVSARLRVRRGQQQAFMRDVKLPSRVRPGQRVTARMRVRRVRGATETISFPVRIPKGIGSGERRVAFRGSDPDTGDEDLFGTLTIDLGDPEEEEDSVDAGPRNLNELVAEIRKLDTYDGIRVSLKGSRRAYEHPTLRVGGRAETTVTVVR